MATSFAVGAHPQCITGVAILVILAERYGIELMPRAVGLVGQAGFAQLATGTAAKDYLVAHGVNVTHALKLTGDASWADDSAFLRSGHIVAIDEVSSLRNPAERSGGAEGVSARG